ncbi:hypothetical protein CDD83_3231 [Cordyceps sp. RAO-2017]|nr:hypothetical protein CDD83_3231 [Cordyceps sp. RAO-2017]
MVYRFALLALAASALGDRLQPRHGYPEHGEEPAPTKTTELVTYTTTTVCPVTSTVTSKGTTYWQTHLTTSTLTVTECKGCGAGVVTVPGPVVTGVTTKLVEVTYTSLCPVTETVTGPGHTYLTTHTVTSNIVTQVPTTIYESVPGPEETKTAVDVVYTTLTSLCPVTKVTTIAGQERTVTYTTTSLIKTTLPTTIAETVTQPDHVATETDVEYKTITSLCPVTKTTTVGGKEYTTTYTTTSLIKTTVPKTVQETVQKPDHVATETDVEYKTITKVYPVTQTTTIGGKEYTTTYTTTKLVETKVPKTVQETVKESDSTVTATDVEYATVTKVYPVTQVTTIAGEVHTKTYTTTKLVKTAIHQTVQETVKQPDTEATQTEVQYATVTKVYPVTQVTTISGEVHTKTYTTTKLVKTAIYQTVDQTVKQPDTTATATDVEYKTITKVFPVTKVTTIGGQEQTITYKTTKVIETQVPVTVQQTVKQPDTTETATDVEYKTVTNVHAVTKVVTVGGEKQTVKYTTTKVVKIHEANTVYTTVTKPGATETETEVEYVTKKVGSPVTETVVVPGAGHTEVVYSTHTVKGEQSTVYVSQSLAPVYTSPPSSLASAVPTAAAQANGVPVVALVVGVAGIMAVL